jgi:nucleotide-binding universal stress UspA family protein
MFKNILVPTDLSDKSLKALDIAAGIVEKEDSRVILLHVVETIEDDGGEEEFRSFYEKLASRAQKKMEEMSNKYINSDFHIRNEIIYGRRVQEIVAYATDKNIDIIILSSHKLEDIDTAHGWATISYQVGILSPCPVMMVK